MKKISLFCTGLLMYLTEIPVLYLLYLAIVNNSEVDSIFKLYPLIIALIAASIFMFIYLYRVIVISYDTIKAEGPFSSKETAVINEGKTLVFTILQKGGKVKVELFGYEEEPPSLSWIQNEDRENVEINLFRERCVGGTKSIRRVLKYFDVPEEDINLIFTSDKFEKSYKNYDVSAEKLNETIEVKIKFTKTI